MKTTKLNTGVKITYDQQGNISKLNSTYDNVYYYNKPMFFKDE